MTDQEKVEKMFEIRKLERPDLKVNDRVNEFCTNPAYKNYHALLKMYNDRYENKISDTKQGTLF